MLACCERSLETCYRRSLSSHAFSDLGLSQTSSMPSFQKQVEKYTFLALDALYFLSNTRSAHELGNNLIMSLHV